MLSRGQVLSKEVPGGGDRRHRFAAGRNVPAPWQNVPRLPGKPVCRPTHWFGDSLHFP